ncbi:MAG: hypothetical protein F6K18_04745 [Okeania sp. SIO2C2]|uniref:hypothetical protein n=1 Tax=Okeania sp. SIO2C2 TaxID=2607787 RepID=UPI0013B80D08|nr:hypothetical protein [Okeania sp. SIO2C2]NEP86182.1 hypothetical protein [Okeania sp. SIO2C2]
MSQNLITVTKLLSVGNIVSASIRIYRDNFKSYCGVAIRATLWFLLPFLAIIPIPLILVDDRANNSSFLLLIPVWLLLFAFCTTKSIVNRAIIGKLVFGVLANKPETVRETRRTLAPKLWIFLWAFLGLFLIGILIGIGVAFVVFVFIAFVFAIISIFTNFPVDNDLTYLAVGITFWAIYLILFMTLLNRFIFF